MDSIFNKLCRVFSLIFLSMGVIEIVMLCFVVCVCYYGDCTSTPKLVVAHNLIMSKVPMDIVFNLFFGLCCWKLGLIRVVEKKYSKTKLELEEHVSCYKCNAIVKYCDECGEPFRSFKLGTGVLTTDEGFIYCNGHKHICPDCFEKKRS